MATISWKRPLLAVAILATATATFAVDKLTILSEGGAASYWRPVAETIATPAYPGIIADKTEDVCIGIGYMLNAEGGTSDYSLLTVWGSKAGKSKSDDPHFTAFAQNAIAAVQRWKFEATTVGNAKIKPVYTAATFAFTTNTATDVQQIKANCKIDDLSQFIADAQAEAYRHRGNLDKSRMEHQRAEPAAFGRQGL